MKQKLYTINGITGTFKKLCKSFGIVAYQTALRRKRLGWSVEDALTIPPQQQNAVERGNKICSVCKERKNVNEFYKLSRRSGKEVMPACKKCASSRTKKDAKRIRLDVLMAYSSDKLECCHCGEDRVDVLDLDHIDGNGNEERKKFKTSRRLFKFLIDNNYPDGYRVLCRNSNWLAYINRKDCENE